MEQSDQIGTQESDIINIPHVTTGHGNDGHTVDVRIIIKPEKKLVFKDEPPSWLNRKWHCEFDVVDAEKHDEGVIAAIPIKIQNIVVDGTLTPEADYQLIIFQKEIKNFGSRGWARFIPNSLRYKKGISLRAHNGTIHFPAFT